MPSTDLTTIKANIETIFTDVILKLETVISDYRNLMLNADNDDLHEALFAFCNELEALKHKIMNRKQPLSNRMDCVGNITQYIIDLQTDTTNFENEKKAKTPLNEIMSGITSIETGLNMIAPEKNVIAAGMASMPETENKKYFMTKLRELQKIVADHPELT